MTTVNFSKIIGRFLWFVAATFPWNRKILLSSFFNDKNVPYYNKKNSRLTTKNTILKFRTNPATSNPSLGKLELLYLFIYFFLFPLGVRVSGVLPFLWIGFCKPTTTNLTMVFDSHSCANQWNDVEHKQQGNRNADCVRTGGKRQLAPVVVFVTWNRKLSWKITQDHTQTVI